MDFSSISPLMVRTLFAKGEGGVVLEGCVAQQLSASDKASLEGVNSTVLQTCTDLAKFTIEDGDKLYDLFRPREERYPGAWQSSEQNVNLIIALAKMLHVKEAVIMQRMVLGANFYEVPKIFQRAKAPMIYAARGEPLTDFQWMRECKKRGSAELHQLRWCGYRLMRKGFGRTNLIGIEGIGPFGVWSEGTKDALFAGNVELWRALEFVVCSKLESLSIVSSTEGFTPGHPQYSPYQRPICTLTTFYFSEASREAIGQVFSNQKGALLQKLSALG